MHPATNEKMEVVYEDTPTFFANYSQRSKTNQPKNNAEKKRLRNQRPQRPKSLVLCGIHLGANESHQGGFAAAVAAADPCSWVWALLRIFSQGSPGKHTSLERLEVI